jgi:glycerate 2-kinase
MAQASGLALVTGELRAVEATTFGTGELIKLAIESGARRCVVGVGGSATTDGGLGALEALGWSLRGVPVQVATDVTTKFVDAARVFGPQKGASPDDVSLLTKRLESLADRFRTELGIEVRHLPRTGAAGGLAGGLAALGAELVSGFDMVADVVGLDHALDRCDVVVSGEGRFDETSFVGKPVGEVLARARLKGLRVFVVCGNSDPDVHHRVDGVIRLVDLAPSIDEAIRQPLPFMRQAGLRLGQMLDR